MNREGLSTVLVLAVFAVLMAWLGLRFNFKSLLIISGLGFVLSLFSIYFFRDPLRTPQADPLVVVSPCDGKVIEVERTMEQEFIQGEAMKISIFMSVFNVHVNYVPYAGTVEFMRYHRGKYYRADLPEASTHNVNILTGLETEHGKIAFKQATGMVARRLVNHLRLGDTVKTGQKFGIIKFGSRMEVYLPLNVNVKVKIGDHVRAGESIIATFEKHSQ